MSLQLQARHLFNPSTSSIEDATHIYKQIQVYNNNKQQLAPSISCTFNQVQLSSIVDSASDYYASIVRWSAQSTLPVIIPDVLTQEGAYKTLTYSGLTNYYIGIITLADIDKIELSGNHCEATRVIYNPPRNITNNYIAPSNLLINQSAVYQNPYFYISNINEFLNYINGALDYLANIIAGDALTTIPRFAFNTSTGKIELLVPNVTYGFGSKGVAPKYAIIINQQLYNIMGSFNLSRLTSTKVWSTSEGEALISQWYSFVPNNDLGRSAFVNQDTDGKTSVIDIITQTNSSIQAMSPVDSIQMETATIPVQNTLVGSPTFLGPPINNSSASQNNVAVLTSYQVGLNSGTEYSQGYIQYSPTTELRLIDCLSNGNIQNLQISVKWLDKIGQSHDMLLPNGQGASMLLLFRKKSFNGR
jgi:hypothetical protein